MNNDDEIYHGPIYEDEDGQVCTLSYMTDLVNYQAQNDQSIADDLKSESPEEYWDDIVSWGKSSGAAIGFEKYDNIEAYAKAKIEKIIKSVTDTEEVYIDNDYLDAWKASFIASPQDLEDLYDSINDACMKHSAIELGKEDMPVSIDDSIMTNHGDVKYVVDFELEEDMIHTSYNADVED